MTPLPPVLEAVLATGAVPRPIDSGIWSVIPEGTPSQRYDGRARLYDRLIGSRLYNRVAWGTSPAAYAAFAHQAAAYGNGPLLDAGCGTLVSTAAIHAASGRPTVLVDISRDMLAVARQRLVAMGGHIPDHLVFLQADLRHLPFRDSVFGSVLCPGMLHLFDDVEIIAAALARVTAPAGCLFMTSLVTDRWLGARYLGALHRSGEVARPRSAAELVGRLGSAASGLARPVTLRIDGGVAFMTGQIATPDA